MYCGSSREARFQGLGIGGESVGEFADNKMVKNKARFQFEQGLNFFHKEDYSQASIYFEEAIVEDPDYSEALYNLACCCSMLGERDKALVYLNRAAKLNPHCQDWANEDREFSGLREDVVFKRIVSGEIEEANENLSPEESQTETNNSDAEFQEVKFKKIESPEPDPELVEEIEGISSNEPPPPLDDGKKPKIVAVKANLPPCLRCEGLVDLETRSLFDPKLSLVIIYVGIVMCCGLLFSFLGFLGIPVVALGLYLFTQTEETWVCQNCGAKGADCGQPKKAEKSK